MRCPNCGKEIEDTAKFCKYCGVEVVKEDVKTKKLFLEEDEKEIAILKRGYIAHFLLGGGLRSLYLLLTNKRIYYSGSVFYGGKRMRGQHIIPLEHITSIKFVQVTSIALLIWACIMIIGGIASIISSQGDGVILVVGLIITIIGIGLLILYIFRRKNYFIISCPSGEISIDFKVYGANAIIEFARKLGKAMDERRREMSFVRRRENE